MRKSISCIGYRNVSLLLFKDESESIARKVQWEKNGELYPPPFPGQGHGNKPPGVTDFNTVYIAPSPSCSLMPSYDDLAVGYFMSSYVPGSPFYYLPEIYSTTASTAQDAVSSIVMAVSLASLSLHVGNDLQLMKNSRMHYSKALTQINVAIASSNTAILDSNLISVLMLGFYEAIAFSSCRSSTSWTAHTLGAIQLLRLRGTKQLKTDLGRHLFMQTCNNIRSGCLQRGMPVPDDFLQLYKEAEPFLDPNFLVVRFGLLLDKIISLKVQLESLIPAQRISGFIHEVLQLDEETRALMNMLPDIWRPQVMPPHITPRWAYQGLAHQYPGHLIARHWNILRLTRAFLNEVIWYMAAFVARAKEQGMPEIWQHCKDLDTDALQTTTAANRIQIFTDVLASVPHFLDESGTTFTPAARLLIWPLTIVAERGMMLEPMRQYALWCLYEIARQARVPEALHAAEAVERGSCTDW